MRTEERKHVRAVVRRVHPDLFAAHPRERAVNSESLKVPAADAMPMDASLQPRVCSCCSHPPQLAPPPSMHLSDDWASSLEAVV